MPTDTEKIQRECKHKKSLLKIIHNIYNIQTGEEELLMEQTFCRECGLKLSLDLPPIADCELYEWEIRGIPSWIIGWTFGLLVGLLLGIYSSYG